MRALLFKIGSNADLHGKSTRIFLVCLGIAFLFTSVILLYPLASKLKAEKPPAVPPVIITLQNIPETRQVVRTPAPPKPFIPSALPIASDDLPPDTLSIADTRLDLDAVPEAPPAVLVPESAGAPPSAAAEEKEVYEFFSVEEQPKRLNAVTPEYPETAKRAGIEGTVMLKVLVNKTGKVDSVEVQKGPAVFHKSAAAAARATTFKPARQNDRAVACWVVMPFRFSITKQ